MSEPLLLELIDWLEKKTEGFVKILFNLLRKLISIYKKLDNI